MTCTAVTIGPGCTALDICNSAARYQWHLVGLNDRAKWSWTSSVVGHYGSCMEFTEVMLLEGLTFVRAPAAANAGVRPQRATLRGAAAMQTSMSGQTSSPRSSLCRRAWH